MRYSVPSCPGQPQLHNSATHKIPSFKLGCLTFIDCCLCFALLCSRGSEPSRVGSASSRHARPMRPASSRVDVSVSGLAVRGAGPQESRNQGGACARRQTQHTEASTQPPPPTPRGTRYHARLPPTCFFCNSSSITRCRNYGLRGYSSFLAWFSFLACYFLKCCGFFVISGAS